MGNDILTEAIEALASRRDLSAEIRCPGHSTFVSKINAAYATCGPTGALRTVGALTGLPIDPVGTAFHCRLSSSRLVPCHAQQSGSHLSASPFSYSAAHIHPSILRGPIAAVPEAMFDYLYGQLPRALAEQRAAAAASRGDHHA